jgi:hypothetical protein
MGEKMFDKLKKMTESSDRVVCLLEKIHKRMDEQDEEMKRLSREADLLIESIRKMKF